MSWTNSSSIWPWGKQNMQQLNWEIVLSILRTSQMSPFHKSLDQLLKVLNWSMPTNILIFPRSEDLCQLIWIIQANGHSLHHTIPIILAVANHVKTSETVDTYCICDGPEYGEMIACDDDECPVEWFHLACVGLKTAPKGKWKCPECGYVSYIFCACLPNILLCFHLSYITTLFL